MTQPATEPHSGRPSAWLMRLALAAAFVLVVAGGIAFYHASKSALHQTNRIIVVTINDKACIPDELTVPAGRTAFQIVNASNRALEWEILDGVMVVDERENILPGFSQTLTTRLPAGDFQITCGLLNNPRGALHVTANQQVNAEAARPALAKFIGALAEYQFFLSGEMAALVEKTQALEAAIRAGDLNEARSLYRQARLPYKRIEAVAERFADLENAIDPVADYLEKREQDPAFTGFHRIEYGLFAQNSLTELAPVSGRLVSDVTELQNRLRGLRLIPDQIMAGAARLLTAIADDKIASGQDHYAQTDLADFEANLDGVEKVIELFAPVVGRAAPGEIAEVRNRMAAARSALRALKGSDGFPPYDSVGAEARTALSQKMRALAESISKLNEAVGLG